MLKLEYNVRHMGKMLAVSVANVIYQTQSERNHKLHITWKDNRKMSYTASGRVSDTHAHGYCLIHNKLDGCTRL